MLPTTRNLELHNNIVLHTQVTSLVVKQPLSNDIPEDRVCVYSYHNNNSVYYSCNGLTGTDQTTYMLHSQPDKSQDKNMLKYITISGKNYVLYLCIINVCTHTCMYVFGYDYLSHLNYGDSNDYQHHTIQCDTTM